MSPRFIRDQPESDLDIDVPPWARDYLRCFEKMLRERDPDEKIRLKGAMYELASEAGVTKQQIAAMLVEKMYAPE